MGIAERKAASQFEETIYPKLKKEIDAAAHFEVPVAYSGHLDHPFRAKPITRSG